MTKKNPQESMQLKITIALSVLLLLTACGIEESATPLAKPEKKRPGLIVAASSYAMDNFSSIRAGEAVIKNGVELTSGTKLGETLHPTIDHLKAMGYSDPYYARGGDASLSFEPSGCERTANAHECTLLVKVVDSGETYVERFSALLDNPKQATGFPSDPFWGKGTSAKESKVIALMDEAQAMHLEKTTVEIFSAEMTGVNKMKQFAEVR